MKINETKEVIKLLETFNLIYWKNKCCDCPLDVNGLCDKLMDLEQLLAEQEQENNK